MGRAISSLQHGLTDRVRDLTRMETRRRVTLARLEARRPTGRFRLLPDFLVIGGQRCGTSSLYTYLGRHPDVVRSLRKEVDYFSTRFPMGHLWYQAHFPLQMRRRWRERLRGRPLLTFEASPSYLFDPRVPARVHRFLPEVKLVALLRNPVERAVSHYLHNRRLGHEDLSFEEAIDREGERTAGELERMLEDPWYRGRAFFRYSYLGRGMYAEQLQRWLELFPLDRMLLVESEEFFAQPQATFHQILAFLEMRAWYPPDFQNYSRLGGRTSSQPAIKRETRRRLAEALAPQNQRLFELVGRDFEWA